MVSIFDEPGRTVYFASRNEHKKAEIQELFPDFDITLPSEQGIIFDPAETGGTFLENSLIKARCLWDIVHAPVLADDSGLCVDILDGKPGIHSARYGGSVSTEEKNRLLLEEVQRAGGEGQGNRSCRVVCCLVLFMSPDRFYVAQETLEGSLLSSREGLRGTGGFGYDPIVLVNSLTPPRTVAELSAAEKNALSHRGKAAAALRGIVRR
jgi:XTP/dITP diphosphohydrolase